MVLSFLTWGKSPQPAPVVAVPKDTSSLSLTIQAIGNIFKAICPEAAWITDAFVARGRFVSGTEGILPLDENPPRSIAFSCFTKIEKGIGTLIAKFDLPESLSCKIEVSIPASPTKPLTPISLPGSFMNKLKALLNPHLAKIEKAGITEKALLDLLLSLPTELTTVHWDGVKGEAEIKIDIPSGGKIKINIKSPKDYGDAFDNSPLFIKEVLEKQLKGLYPVVKPLLVQNIRFTWFGQSSQFALTFIPPQMVVVRKLELIAGGALASIAASVGEGTKILLPAVITGTFDFKAASLHLTGKGLPLSIQSAVDINLCFQRVAFDPDKNTISIAHDWASLGVSGSRTQLIDLKTESEPSVKTLDLEFQCQSLDDKDFFLVEEAKEKPPSASRVIAASPPVTHLSLTIQTIARLVKTIFPPLTGLVDAFLAAGHLASTVEIDTPIEENPPRSVAVSCVTKIKKGAGSIFVRFDLPESVSCTIDASIPSAPKPFTPISLHQAFIDKLKALLKPRLPTAGVTEDELLALLLSLPAELITVRWDGVKGEADIIVNLPGGGDIKINIKSPKNYGDAFENLPSFVKEVLKAKLEALFPIVKPLLQQNISFSWDGKKSQFELIFIPQQMVVIKSIKLIAQGFLATIVQAIGKDTKIILPEKISGVIDPKTLSITFNNLILDIDRILLPTVTIYKASFDPDKNVVFVDYKGGYKLTPDKEGTAEIDLSQSSVQEIDLGFARAPKK